MPNLENMQSFTRIRDKLLKIWDPNFVGNFLQPGVFYIFLAHFATDSCELRIITKFDIINKAVELRFFLFCLSYLLIYLQILLMGIIGKARLLNRSTAGVRSLLAFVVLHHRSIFNLFVYLFVFRRACFIHQLHSDQLTIVERIL